MVLRSKVLAALVAVVLSACRGEEERTVSREVASVAHAVNQLREAPHNAKEVPLTQLKAIACKAAPACELQQVCVTAYRLHAEAVQMGVQASEQGTSGYGPQLAAELLARAEKQLADAKAGAERCVALEGELTRRFKL